MIHNCHFYAVEEACGKPMVVNNTQIAVVPLSITRCSGQELESSPSLWAAKPLLAAFNSL